MYFNNSDWKAKQDAAAEREFAKLRKDITAAEAALNIPPSNLPNEKLRQRLHNLRALAARFIDPDDNETQTEPIIWGDPRYFKH